jgi:hypothetical protein
VADLNNDGNQDLVLGTVSAYVNVALGNTNGVFQPVVAYPASASSAGAQEVAVADFDLDGKLDIAALFPGQRVCMKGFSQFRPLVGDKGHGHAQVIFAHGGLEIGK